jgi:hypothetical protein
MLSEAARSKLARMFRARHHNSYPIYKANESYAEKRLTVECIRVPKRAGCILYGRHAGAFRGFDEEVQSYQQTLENSPVPADMDAALLAMLRDIFPQLSVKNAPNVPLRYASVSDGSLIMNWAHMRNEAKTAEELVNFILFKIMAPLQEKNAKFNTQPVVQRLLQRRAAEHPRLDSDKNFALINTDAGKAYIADWRLKQPVPPGMKWSMGLWPDPEYNKEKK